MKKDFDIVILGAGLVGMFLALKLAKESINVCLIDKQKKTLSNAPKDNRTTAVSQGSSRMLKTIGLWKNLQSFAQPINKIVVTEGLSGSKINFDSRIANQGPMGFIIENQLLRKAFINRIENSKRITFLDRTEITNSLSNCSSHLNLVANGKSISCNLLVGADGRYSKTRFHANIKYHYQEYGQNAYVFCITHKKPHNAVALERFFPDGPLALLPMKTLKGNKSSVVWTVDGNREKSMKNFDDEFKKKFKVCYQNFFGSLINISKPSVYPLNIFSCYDYFRNRVVLIGDACQAIHPIAGQGFNLGLRDAFFLSQSLKNAKNLGLDYGSQIVLKKYSQKRTLDKAIFIQSTHRLNNFFSNNSKIIKKLRETGLKIFNKSLFLKKQSMLFAMGLKSFEI